MADDEEDVLHEDARWNFIGKQLFKSMKLDKEKWTKFAATDDTIKHITDFFDKPDAKLLLFYNDGTGIVIEGKFSSHIKSKGLYIARKRRGPIPNAKAQVTTNLTYGEFPANPLDHLSVFVDEVLVNLLTNPRNHNNWPDVVIEDVKRQTYRLKDRVYVINGQIKGKTLLSIPHGLDQVELDKKFDFTKHRSLIHSVESAVVDWSHLIRDVLKQDKAQAVGNHKPLPEETVIFWENRHKSLEFIYVQMVKKPVKKMAALLNSIGSTYHTALQDLISKVAAALDEAYDCRIHLTPLKNTMYELEAADFNQATKTFRPLLHTLSLVWLTSKHFSTTTRMVALLKEVSNLVIEAASNYLDPESILRSDCDDALLEVDEAVKFCRVFKSRYVEFKTNLNAKIAERQEQGEEGLKPLNIPGFMIFERVDRFIKRLIKLKSFFFRSSEIFKLEKVEFGGVRGRVLSIITQDIYRKFKVSYASYGTLTIDPLDPDDLRFEKTMEKFNAETVDVDRKLSAIVCKAFEDCCGLLSCFKLLSIFGTIMDRPIIKRDFDISYTLMMNMYSKDLDMSKEIFDKHVKDYNSQRFGRSNPLRPCIHKNMPHTAGQLYYCQELINRITWPIELFISSGKSFFQGEQFDKLLEKKDQLLGMINQFREKVFASWVAVVDDHCVFSLVQNLLKRLHQSKIEVNFNPKLVAVLREVHYLRHLERKDVPAIALSLYRRNEPYMRYVINLGHIVRCYNETQSTLLDVEYPLVEQQIFSIDVVLKVAEDFLTWSQDGFPVEETKEEKKVVPEITKEEVKEDVPKKRVVPSNLDWLGLDDVEEVIAPAKPDDDEEEQVVEEKVEDEEEELNEDGPWSYDETKDPEKYTKKDMWQYIEGTREAVVDLHNRVCWAKANIENIRGLMQVWCKSSLFKRRLVGQVAGLLDIDNRENRIKKKYGMVTDFGIQIHNYIEENLKHFRAVKDSKIWMSYLDYVDTLVVKGFHDCLATSINFFLENTEPDVQPLLTAELLLNGRRMVFNPSLDPNDENSFLGLITGLIDDIYGMSTLINRVSVTTERVHYLPDMKDDDELTSLRSTLIHRVNDVLKQAYEYSREFMVYSNLWSDDKKQFLDQFLTYGRILTPEDLEQAAYGLEEKKPTLQAFKGQIDSYEELYIVIGEYGQTETFSGWLQVHMKSFLQSLLTIVKSWSFMFKEHLISHVTDSLWNLDNFIKETDEVLLTPLVKGDYDGLVKCMAYLTKLAERQEETDEMFEPLKQTIEMLKTYNQSMPDEVYSLLSNLPEKWGRTKKLAVKARQIVVPLEAGEVIVIRKKCVIFDHKITAFRDKFITEPFFDFECDAPYLRLDAANKKIEKYEAEEVALLKSAAIFQVDAPEYRKLSLCRRDVAMCKQVWDLAKLITSSTDAWNVTVWGDINVESMEIALKGFAKDIRGLDKETKPWKLAIDIDSLVKNKLASLKAVGELQNPAIRERHWRELQIATQVDFVMTEETTFKNLLDLHLHNFEEEVREIVDKAVKEMGMEKTLSELEVTWKHMEFEYSTHPRTKTKLIQCSEELMETLEDNQGQVQNLMTSKFIGHFVDEVGRWTEVLSTADAILSCWLDVQRTWGHLESIFVASDDIRKQLPEDSVRFDGVDKEFKEIMADAVKTPNVVEATSKPGLLDRFERLKDNLTLCEKALAQYLETKRLSFPRFYFISSPDLLDILANGNNPVGVATHLSKLFDNLVGLKFEKKNGVPTKFALSMFSGEGEEFTLVRPHLCEGQVEKWLGKLLDVSHGTIRATLAEAVVTYEEKPRDVWMFDYPAQPVLGATQIWWTTEVGIAFVRFEEGYETALKDYYKKQVSQLNMLIGHLIGDLTRQMRQSIMTVCTMDVHARDVVAKLITLKVESASEFLWQSQLRHRWCDVKRHCYANICDAQFQYSYEYLGNCPRLVITPLTDRCYITLTQSLHLIMGGAPAGPAGTGKTETTKDLARSLAIMIYVFNCSEQMDYKSCGNIYKGLAQTGAWGCFDEFNRITVEVLSVIAVQVKSIQDAIRYKKKRFMFQGEDIILIPTVGVFITMNPGYAGRTELPENLKALFRPCAMVVPDFELICEIMLVAEGFMEGRILARKFLTLYTLCKQLLSAQDHYDWGLRAIKSVLVVAGALKRGDKTRPEDQVLMRALRDFNLPKIVTDDLPVFMGLIGDLFPGVNVPRKRDFDLEADCKQAVKDRNLQGDDAFILKLVQLDELLYVRHSVFVIGNAGSGKSEVLKCLFRSYKNQKRRPVWVDLNPKAVTNDELFGIISPATREWKDGLFSTLMRDLSVITHNGPKWIVLDGDIDPMWIESLNTVMDDNKILTLASNERIPLNPSMRLLFEISNLRTATPATVSRAGILFINPGDLGWNPVVTSWIDKRPNPTERANLTILFDKYIPNLLESTRTKFLTVTPIQECAKIRMLLHLLDCLLTPANIEQDSPKETYELYFVFSCVWAFGGSLFQDQLVDHRLSFSKWWTGEFKTVKFPVGGTVFDFCIDNETLKFVPWTDSIPKFDFDPDLPLQACMVPTSETVRIRYFMDLLMEAGIPVMLVGNAGTGKTVVVQSKLRRLDDRFMVQNVPFNFYTTSMMLQNILERPLEKKAGRSYGPPGTKRMVYFIDDMNMPEVDTYGTVAPHTIIRQHIDYKHWYDRVKLTLKEINNVQYVSCMNPTAGSFTVNSRLQRHFCVFAVSFPGKDSVVTIYNSIIKQYMEYVNFPKSIKLIGQLLVQASTKLHQRVVTNFLPTAIRFHYIFNLRDLSNLFQGLLYALPENIKHPLTMVRMWMHEVTRVYSDKLVDAEDKSAFDKIKRLFAEETFEQFPIDDIKKEPIIFCHFAKGIGDINYAPINDLSYLNKLLCSALDSYNEWNSAMNLVLFEDAMSHILRINRILESPRGNALLVGVGGSGKQSLSRLAAFISGLDVFQITLRKGYGVPELKLDIASLYLQAGLKSIPTMFLLTDAQIGDELFLVLVNDLLASGEIPDLLPEEDYENVLAGVAQDVKAQGLEDSRENCWQFFIERVRRQLKVVLCFSPVGSTLRIRARKFPALVNCTQIDWFMEWPRDALESVSYTFLQPMTTVANEVKPSISNFMAFMHISVNDASKTYLQNERRYNYTTPKSFLEQIALYKRLMETKSNELAAKTSRLENGIMKLEDTAAKVDDLKAQLADQEIELKAKNKDTDQLIEVLGIETAKVTKEKEFADMEEEKVSAFAKAVLLKQRECEEDLEKAEPALLAAREALNTLNKNNLTELKSFGSPPSAVVKVLAAVLVLTSGGNVPKDRSWKASKLMMSKVDGFLDQLVYYDKENIHEKSLKEVRPYLKDPEFTPEFIKAKSGAAAGLCSWVINIVGFYDVFCEVEPKRLALVQANVDLKAAEDKMALINTKLHELDLNLAELTRKFQVATDAKLKCQQEAEQTALTINLANRLVGGLASENVRWKKAVDGFKSQIHTLPGDVLLICAFVSYVGYFVKNYRSSFFEDIWLPYLKNQEVQIPMTENLDPLTVLNDDADLAAWSNEGLPSDKMSIENATILTNCARWPLMVDPQLQGIVWIKRRYKKNLVVVRLDKKGYLDTIESALSSGRPLLIENVGESLDPILNPILGRETIKKGRYMKIGDKEVPYNRDFKLIIQTCLANPHYQPEMQAQCTLINFTVTIDGLEDQLLAQVVKRERSDLEETKAALTLQQNNFKITLKALEDSLLSRLSNASGNFLGDTALVENLETTKKTAAEIEVKVAEALETEISINQAREIYRPVAIRASILYFILNELNVINPIYQFSLKSFNVVFSRAINLAEKGEDVKERVENLIETTTYSVYQYTNRGLFEKDKLTFSAKIAFSVLLRAGEISSSEYNCLLVFPVKIEEKCPIPYLSAWSWGAIKALSELEELRGFDKDIESSPKRWRKFAESDVPEKEKYPAEWKGKNGLQKLLMMRALRPDRMTYAVRDFVGASLGVKYTENRNMEFAVSWEESDPLTPIFFVLSPGVDPLKDVEALGHKLGYSTDKRNFHNISLGQGQEVIAEQAIDFAVVKGHWVILQNVHLVAKWLPALEKKIEFAAIGSHPNYRLYVSAEPAGTPSSHILPQSILQRSIKITNEPPTGMQANLHKALDNFNQDTLERSTKEVEFRSILQSVCYFHAVLSERKKFGAQGWNRCYPFNVGDLTICIDVLYNYLETSAKVPWDDLRYLFCEIMYGGHITDDWDRKLCKTYLEVYMDPAQLDGEVYLAPGYLVPPDNDYKGYHAYIDEMLPPESPILYGLHPNAEIAVLTATADYLFDTILAMEPKGSSGGGEGEITREEKVVQFIEEVLDKMPEPFKILEMLARCTDRNPYVVVVFQECERMNSLTMEMRRSLTELQLGLKGELTVTAAMENLEEAIFYDRVPASWSKLAYPSSAGLSAWYADLGMRTRELEAWTADFTLPNSVWLGGLFNPQSFLTAIMQSMARKNEWPLDKMCLQCDPTKKMSREDITAPPREGSMVHGLFMEGARWDMQTGSIAEARMKDMLPPVPVVFIRAIPVDRQETKNMYACPVYKTKNRGPTFVWTFNLKTKEKASRWIIGGVGLLLQG